MVALPWPLSERQAMVLAPPIRNMTDRLTAHTLNRQEQTCLQRSATVCMFLDSLQLSAVALTVHGILFLPYWALFSITFISASAQTCTG